MDDIQSVVGGLRALLFCSAMISAIFFFQEVNIAWNLICSIWHGRFRSNQLVGLAAFGWFIGAIGSMALTFHRLLDTIVNGTSPAGLGHGWDAVWSAVGLYFLSVGFFLPVFAALCYRRSVFLAFALGFAACFVGVTFGILSNNLPTHCCH